MSGEQNKDLARRWFAAFNANDLAAVEQLFAADVRDHTAPAGLPPGVDGMKALVSVYRGAFPDLTFTVEDLVADAGAVAGRWTTRGTHLGPLAAIPPTGRSFGIDGHFVLRVAGGKITEHWVTFDEVGLLQQLGVIPTPEPATAG